MESANHLNDSIIINQPHISSKEGKEIVLSDTEDNSMNDTDIVYLNLNDDDPLDDDEYVVRMRHAPIFPLFSHIQ